MLAIDETSDVPLAEQVRLGLRRAIAAGELAPGDPLPTVRALAGDLGLSLATVARAYRQLEGEGLLATVRGRGTVVTNSRESAAVAGPAGERLAGQARDLLAAARLAGFTRRQFEKLIAREAAAFWKG
jgi:GntR family transcriptional regulator